VDGFDAARHRMTAFSRDEGTVQLEAALTRMPVVAILRSMSADRFGAATEVLVDAGLPIAEFTLTTAGALDALRACAAAAPPELLLGAGTVVDAEQAEAAVDAGARFLVSPIVRAEVIGAGARLGVPVLPGAFTATEIVTAWEAGACAVKLFPASVGGPGYVRALRAPLPDVPIVPTGGIALEDVPAYLRAGAAAVGLGSPLLGDACEPGGDLEALAARARRVAQLATAASAT
jgi:2-dehydro-3-deoxyphosphogluconate aldolase / (4S)-4-hydroxy-2-oxoglutarate aldolase